MVLATKYNIFVANHIGNVVGNFNIEWNTCISRTNYIM